MGSLVFVTLTPANALAKVAFSDVYDALMLGQQGAPPNTLRRMKLAEPQQVFDGDVLRLYLEAEGRSSRNGDVSDVSLTEPSTETEAELREYGMVWMGYFVLDPGVAPEVPELGWTAGKGLRRVAQGPNASNVGADLVLCTKSFVGRYSINLPSVHARFNFSSDNGALFIAGCSRSQLAPVKVNGEQVQGRQLFALNQHKMKIGFGSFEYDLEYTDFAKTGEYVQRRRGYLTDIVGAPKHVPFEVPTPLPNTRTMGQWTLGAPLGKGAQGRVFLATNTKNETAAVKVLETSKEADDEVRTSTQVTKMAQEYDEGGRIVRQVEVLRFAGEGLSHHQAVFNEVAIILQPMTPGTFHNLLGNRSKGQVSTPPMVNGIKLTRGSARERKGMTIEAAAAVRDALLGVKVLHDHQWVHRDLKPANIGLIGKPPKSVLLDTCNHLEAGHMARPTPGRGGTVHYLAPEQELEEYDFAVDIWAMAVIGYQLTYGHHSWRLSLNPWRSGKDHEKLQPTFRDMYKEAIGRLSEDYQGARRSPAGGYIHLGALLVQMLRHPWAATNHERRIDIDEVLAHPNWGPEFLPEQSRVKRGRLGDDLEDGEV